MKNKELNLNQVPLRNHRLFGSGLIVLALALDLLLWVIAGPQALLIGVSSGAILIVFGGLLLSGRWPVARQRNDREGSHLDR